MTCFNTFLLILKIRNSSNDHKIKTSNHFTIIIHEIIYNNFLNRSIILV